MGTESRKVQDRKKRETKVLERKPYSRPKITEFGSLQKITLGSSTPGTGDSGNGSVYTFPS
jgi:hypothetical protein